MKALSILQPYAWLIIHGHKDVENRTWLSHHLGRFLVHAGKKYSRIDHEEYSEFMLEDHGIQLPRFEEMPQGAIVGEACMWGCVRTSGSRWADPGSFHFLLRDAKPCPPVPYRGQLGFFEITHAAGVVDLFSTDR